MNVVKVVIAHELEVPDWYSVDQVVEHILTT